MNIKTGSHSRTFHQVSKNHQLRRWLQKPNSIYKAIVNKAKRSISFSRAASEISLKKKKEGKKKRWIENEKLSSKYKSETKDCTELEGKVKQDLDKLGY